MTQKIRLTNRPPAIIQACQVTGRFLSGRPLSDGQHRTDATWTHRGSRSYGPRRACWWHYLTKSERVGARLGALGSAGGALYGLWTDMSTTTATLHHGAVGVGSVGSAWTAYKGTDALLYWRHHHEWVWPLHLVLKEALSLPEGTRPRHYMAIPRDFNELAGDILKIELPASWAGGDQEGRRASVQAAITSKLALQDVTFGWQLTGRDHYVMVRATPRPPDVVRYATPEIQELIRKAPESAPVLGLTHSNRVVAVSLDTESPHILVSMSPGGGKSTILRAMAAQFLHNGANVVVLDFKKHSHKWIRGIPGVKYCRTMPEIHDALIELGEEGNRRNDIVEAYEGEDDRDAPVGPRTVILFEEANATIRKLKAYWKKIRPHGAPPESPALEGFGDLLYMGRAVKLNIILVAQSATANALGGPEVRECFATRILARYTRNAWMMLVPEAGPPPRKINHTGRAQVVINGTSPHETQMLLFSDAEARAYALSGRAPAETAAPSAPTGTGTAASRPLPSHGAPHTTTHGPPPGESAPEPHTPHVGDTYQRGPFRVYVYDGEGQDSGAAAAPPPAAAAPEIPQYALFEISQDHPKGKAIVPLTYTALRTAKKDDPEFPPPDGKRRKSDTWYAETIVRWHRNRPRATGSE